MNHLREPTMRGTSIKFPNPLSPVARSISNKERGGGHLNIIKFSKKHIK
jgi:hypothetical protein